MLIVGRESERSVMRRTFCFRTKAGLGLALTAIFVVACSGAGETPLDNPNKDAGASPGMDAQANPAMCDLSRCGITVPAGFALMTAQDGAGACPSGFAKRDLISDP